MFSTNTENPFDKEDITDQHFLGFTKDAKSSFEVANILHQFDDIVGLFSPKIIVFENEIDTEDTSINIRKGKIKSVVGSGLHFNTIMSEPDGVIAFNFCGYVFVLYNARNFWTEF